MGKKFLDGLIVGLEILASITGGLAIFTGLAKLFSRKKEAHLGPEMSPSVDSSVDMGSSLDQDESRNPEADNILPAKVNKENKANTFSQKFSRLAQICIGLCEVVSSIGTLVGSIGKVFGSSGGMPSTNYSGYPQIAASGFDKDGDPYDVPVYKGNDPQGNPIYWIKRRNGITEVY